MAKLSKAEQEINDLLTDGREKSKYLAKQEWIKRALCATVFLLTDEEIEEIKLNNNDGIEIDKLLENENQRKVSAVFHPSRGESVEPAKQICAKCPVQKECFSYSLHHEEKNGVWGGAAERLRRRIRRQRNIIKKKTRN